MKSRIAMRCLFLLAPFSAVLSLVSCAPGDLGSEVARSDQPSTRIKATFIMSTCIRRSDSETCDKITDRSVACSVASGTQVTIENLTGPRGFSINEPHGVDLAASAVFSIDDPASSNPSPVGAGDKGQFTSSRLEEILGSIGFGLNDSQQGPADGNHVQPNSSLSPCTDAKLKQLASTSGSGRLPLRIWSKAMTLEPGARIRTEDLGAFSIVFPTKGVLSSYYGMRRGRMHKGIDIANSIGTPIVSAQDGVVHVVFYEAGGWGHALVINHGSFQTLYAHMPSSPNFIGVGNQAARGARIGTIGSSGRSTGPHTHFELCSGKCEVGAIRLDPLSRIDLRENRSWIENLSSVLPVIRRVTVFGWIKDMFGNRSDAGAPASQTIGASAGGTDEGQIATEPYEGSESARM